MTDAYTKSILTVIAIALVAIAMKLTTPQAHAGFGSGPTVGDLKKDRDVIDDAPIVFVVNKS